MNATCKKSLRIFVRCSLRNVKFKEFSTTLRPEKILQKQFDSKEKKNKQFVRPVDKNKILRSLLASEISPFLNESAVSLLKFYITSKRNFPMKYTFVVDDKVAKDIVNRILPELKQERSFVVEGNPGLGLITVNLIMSQVPKIHLYDNSKLKCISLLNLINKYPGQLELENYNIFSPRPNHLLSVFDKALTLNFNCKIIGIVQQLQFFSSFIEECINCSLWNHVHETDFFLIVSKTIWKNLMEDSDCRLRYYTYFFFNLIFETKLLAEYPNSAFLPFSPKFKEENMFFVKITKKSDFPGTLTPEDLKSLQNFCKILSTSKFNYIIPTAERWIPGCGPYLISKGISVSNQTNDLSFDEFKQLYFILKMFKGFRNLEIVNEGDVITH